MNTEHLKYIIEIANHHSISQAADELHLQRSYLSKVIAAVEKELEATLFKRSPKGIIPTQEGALIIEQLQEITTILENIKAKNITKGNQVIYPQYHEELTFFSPPQIRPRISSSHYLPVFQQKYPNVMLAMINVDLTQMIDAVRAQPLSVAAFMRCSLLETLYRPIPADMIFYLIADTSLVALAAPENQLAQSYQSISLATLAKQDLILMDGSRKEDSLCHYLLKPYGKSHVKYYVSTLSLYYQLLKQNDCFSIGLYSEDVSDNLRQIPIRDSPQIQQGFLVHQDTLKNKIGHDFVETILAYYKRRRV